MTGERMETVREALDALNLIGMNGVPTACTLAVNALAEVERWEHDRARDKRIETAARHYLNGTDPDAYINLRAALGEGQDSDQPKRGKWAALCPACKGYPDQSHTNDENCLANQDQRVAEAGGCAFGCGPYPADGPHVGSGVGLVPACPTHGWVCALLDARDEALKAAEVEVERLTAALREIANDPVEALVVKRAREALAGKETTT